MIKTLLLLEQGNWKVTFHSFYTVWFNKLLLHLVEYPKHAPWHPSILTIWILYSRRELWFIYAFYI